MNRIRGVGVGNQNNIVYTSADVQRLHRFGYNTIRFMFGTDFGSAWDHTISPWGSAYTTDSDDQTNEAQAQFLIARGADITPYLSQVSKIISILDEADKFGMKVIVCANRVVGRPNFLVSEGARDEFPLAWGAILPAINTHAALLGCEVANESECWGERNGGAYGDNGTWDEWRDTYQPAIVAAIREHWSGPIFLDPRWNNVSGDHLSMDLTYLDNVTLYDDPGIVYVQHIYWPLKWCQNTWDGADYNYGVEYLVEYGTGDFVQMPAGSGDFTTRKEMYFYLQPLIDFKNRNNVEVMVGEFGAVRWAPGRDAWMVDLLDIMEENGFHWCFHSETRLGENEYDGFNSNLDTTIGYGAGLPLKNGASTEIESHCKKNKPRSFGT